MQAQTTTDHFIERDCIFEHDGHGFEAGGAIINGNAIIAYIQNDATRESIGHVLEVQTWHGDRIGTARITSKWMIPHRHWTMFMFSYRVHLDDGREYNARGQGPGYILSGRRAS